MATFISVFGAGINIFKMYCCHEQIFKSLSKISGTLLSILISKSRHILLKNILPTPTDLGPVQWEAETLPDGTHQHCARRGRQHSQPLPLLMWRRQAGQVLGSGVQQGTMSLQERVQPLGRGLTTDPIAQL